MRRRQSEADVAALAKRAAAGEQRAWRALVDLWSARILSVGRRYFRDEDDRREHFVSSLEHLSRAVGERRYDPARSDSRGLAWVGHIARNAAIDLLRRRTGRAHVPKAVEALAADRGSHLRTLYLRLFREGAPEREVVTDLLTRDPDLNEPQLERDLIALHAAVSSNFAASVTMRRSARSRARSLDDVSVAALDATPEEALGAREAGQLLHGLLESVGPPCRALFTARFWHDRGFADIGRELSLGSAYKAKQALAHCVTELKQALLARGHDPETLRHLLDESR